MRKFLIAAVATAALAAPIAVAGPASAATCRVHVWRSGNAVMAQRYSGTCRIEAWLSSANGSARGPDRTTGVSTAWNGAKPSVYGWAYS